jgi:hypothetical protein
LTAIRFGKSVGLFELRDVTTPEHDNFCAVFAARHDWKFKKEGTIVTFFSE